MIEKDSKVRVAAVEKLNPTNDNLNKYACSISSEFTYLPSKT